MKGKGSDAVAWLESPEGEAWSRSRHAPIYWLVTIKNTGPQSSIPDALIWYGMRPSREAISRSNCA